LVGEYCSLVPSDDYSVTKISRILSLESNLKGILRSALMKTSQTYYNSSYKDTYLGYMYLCNTYSNIYSSKERQSPTNDVPKSSVRTFSTNETQEYTSSKLPRVVMADSG
ncbi:uncharacterized protein DC041_0003802, partial [Schistosoma bovis]